MVDSLLDPANTKKRKLLDILHIDPVLLVLILCLSGVGLLVLYSASLPELFYVKRQLLHFGIAFVVMFVVAQIKVDHMKMAGLLAFLACLALLVLVPMVGVSHKGAQRWISLGVMEFQPSELMKLALPMMVALYLSKTMMPIRLVHFLIALGIVLVPTLLIAMQPDLGTALLIASSGVFIIFFAGISWRVIGVGIALLAAFLPVFWLFLIKEYQRTRILTMLDPEKDPLGSGYHIIQSKIAIGSGGLYGKGWTQGSQSQLEFLPERHTDFIFAVLAEEFGFLGVLVFLGLIFLIVARGLWISTRTKDIYSRLLAGSISMTFFFYCFVNIGMVSGVLPVVGLPLPLQSYGGTALITIFMGFGILMAIYSHKTKL